MPSVMLLLILNKLLQIKQICSIFDIFYVSFNPSLVPNKNKPTYQSVFGGIVSIGIYTFILLYSVNLLMTWLNNEMVMKVSSQQEFTGEFYDIFLSSTSSTNLAISPWWNENEDFNPFSKDEIIILPLLLNVYDNSIKNLITFYNETEGSIQVKIANSDLEGEYFIIFVSCIGNEELLDINQKCSKIEKSEQFWSLTSLALLVDHEKSVLNVYTEEVKTIHEHSTIFLQERLSFFSHISYSYSYSEIKKGFFFQYSTKYLLQNQYRERISFTQEGYLGEYLHTFYGAPLIPSNIFGVILITGDNTINHVIAQYPTVSEILASIGSIFQTLLLIRFLIFIFNKHQMINQFKEAIKKIYFSDLDKIIKIGEGKQRKYCYNQKTIEKKHYKEFLLFIDKKLEEKLNYVNLIYEISKMQMILQELVDKETIIKTHLKLNLHLEHDENTNSFKISNKTKNQQQDQPGSQRERYFDPFLFNHSSGQQYADSFEKNIITQYLKSIELRQQQREMEGISSEIQIESQHIPSLGSLRPQQSS